MANTGRHSASALQAGTGPQQHGKTALLLGIGAGAQVLLLVGVGAFGGFGHRAGAAQAIVADVHLPAAAQRTVVPSSPVPQQSVLAADQNAAIAPAPDDTGVLGKLLRASASGTKITAATVPGVTSPTTIGGNSGALPVISFPNKPVIPPDPTPGPPVTTPTPPGTPTSTPTTAPPITVPPTTAPPTIAPPVTTSPTEPTSPPTTAPPGPPTDQPTSEPTTPADPGETTPADPDPVLPIPTVPDPTVPDPPVTPAPILDTTLNGSTS